MEGFSGMVRLDRLDETDLRAQERHGKRLDQTSQERKISEDPPLTTTGLDLEELLREHEQGAARQAGSDTRAIHMIVHFPTQLVDGDDGELMLREARRFAEGVFGPDAIFADRCDRDEHSRHVVDLFIAPKYVKHTKKGGKLWISMSRDLKNLARRHGELNKQGEPDLPAQGRALQTEIYEHLVHKMGLQDAVRGERKARAGDDWKTPEEMKAKKIREAAQQEAAELRAKAKEEMKAAQDRAFANEYAAYVIEQKMVVGFERTPDGKRHLTFKEDIPPDYRKNILSVLEPAWDDVCRFIEMHFEIMADVDQGKAEVEGGRRELEADRAAVERAREKATADAVLAARAALDSERQKIAADRQRLEAEKSTVLADRAAVDANRVIVDRYRQKITADRQQLEAEKSTVARAAAAVDADRAAVDFDRKKIAADRQQLKADQGALAEKEKATEAFITGVEAWHDGRITGASINSENEKVMTFNCPTPEEQKRLVHIVSPAWNRLWDFVRIQMAHLKKLLEREKKANEAIAAAEAVKQKLEAARAATENVAKQLSDGLARLPVAVQGSAEAAPVKKALEKHQAVKTENSTADQEWEDAMRAMQWKGYDRGR